jgi:hypothetical protein
MNWVPKWIANALHVVGLCGRGVAIVAALVSYHYLDRSIGRPASAVQWILLYGLPLAILICGAAWEILWDAIRANRLVATLSMIVALSIAFAILFATARNPTFSHFAGSLVAAQAMSTLVCAFLCLTYVGWSRETLAGIGGFCFGAAVLAAWQDLPSAMIVGIVGMSLTYLAIFVIAAKIRPAQ